MAFKHRIGKLSLIRVNDGPNHAWGGGNDVLQTEVIVTLKDHKNFAAGFDIKNDDPNLAPKLAMLATLRDALIHNKTVLLAYHIQPGKQNGKLARIQIHDGSKSPPKYETELKEIYGESVPAEMPDTGVVETTTAVLGESEPA